MPAVLRRLTAGAAVALAALFFPVVAPAATPHELRFADAMDVSSLNIFLATSANIVPLSELTMAEFTRFDASGRPIPELITEIPTPANGGVSRDGTTVTWHLRHNVRWSDGAPFDAGDVVYTFRVATDPSNSITSHDVWDRLAAVTARDRYTVVFHFKRPDASFVGDYFSTLSVSCILPQHVLGPGTAIDEAAYNALPVGIGPFRYAAYHRGDDVVMEANPYYWRGRPKLDRVIYKIVTDENTLLTQLETGELDLWDIINGALAQRVKSLPGRTVSTRASDYLEAVAFNLRRPGVDELRVREALQLAVDRRLILAKVALGNGFLTQSVVPRIADGALALPVVTCDPARAGRLLDAAGWRRGADGMRRKNGALLALDLAIPAGQPTRATTAAVLRDAWTALGVSVTIHPWAPAQFFAPSSAGGVLETGRFDAAIMAGGLGPSSASISGGFDCASVPPRGFNVSFYCDRHVDALNDRYLRTFDERERVRVAAEMQRTIDRAVPEIVLYERTFVAAHDARLRGYHPSSYSYWGDPLELDL